MAAALKIEEKQVMRMDGEERDILILENLTAIRKDVEALKRRKRFDTTLSAGTGIIGGGLAVFLREMFK